MLLFTLFFISFTYILVLAVFHVIHVTNRGESVLPLSYYNYMAKANEKPVKINTFKYFM